MVVGKARQGSHMRQSNNYCKLAGVWLPVSVFRDAQCHTTRFQPYTPSFDPAFRQLNSEWPTVRPTSLFINIAGLKLTVNHQSRSSPATGSFPHSNTQVPSGAPDSPIP